MRAPRIGANEDVAGGTPDEGGVEKLDEGGVETTETRDTATDDDDSTDGGGVTTAREAAS